MQKVPIGWLNLIHKPWRFFVTLAGVLSAVTLMFIEFGFQNAMFDSQVSVIRALDADILILAESSYTLSVDRKFPLSRLTGLRAIGGIEEAIPVYIDSQRFKIRNPQNGERYTIRVLAVDLSKDVFQSDFLDYEPDAIRELDTALIDLHSKSVFGVFEEGTQTEVGSRRFKITGLFSLGTDFVNDGNLLMSERSYFRLSPNLEDEVALGLIRVKPGRDIGSVQALIQRSIPKDISVLTQQNALERERDYWRESTFIGFIFGLATIIGFVVGLVVCSQILYAGVVDYLPQYATMKAIGYSNGYLIGIVIRQGITIAVLGFLPGLGVSLLLYGLISSLTGLPMEITVYRLLVVFILTLGMCILSASMAITKILHTDPAEVFK